MKNLNYLKPPSTTENLAVVVRAQESIDRTCEMLGSLLEFRSLYLRAAMKLAAESAQDRVLKLSTLCLTYKAVYATEELMMADGVVDMAAHQSVKDDLTTLVDAIAGMSVRDFLDKTLSLRNRSFFIANQAVETTVSFPPTMIEVHNTLAALAA